MTSSSGHTSGTWSSPSRYPYPPPATFPTHPYHGPWGLGTRLGGTSSIKYTDDGRRPEVWELARVGGTSLFRRTRDRKVDTVGGGRGDDLLPVKFATKSEVRRVDNNDVPVREKSRHEQVEWWCRGESGVIHPPRSTEKSGQRRR